MKLHLPNMITHFGQIRIRRDVRCVVKLNQDAIMKAATSKVDCIFDVWMASNDTLHRSRVRLLTGTQHELIVRSTDNFEKSFPGWV